MRQGFFTLDEIDEQSSNSKFKGVNFNSEAKCGVCKLHKQCKSPFMKVSGKGKKEILIVGEAPGADEDEEGKPFVGKAGRKLSSVLSRLGISMRQDCWITNTIICRPPNNQTPTPSQIDCCNPNLVSTINRLEPKVIISLGAVPTNTLVSMLWKSSESKDESMTKWAGWTIPLQELNCWLCPTFHPSYILRNEGTSNYDVLFRMFTEHLKVAIQKSKRRPWKKVPNHKKEVQIIMDKDEVVERIRRYRKEGGLLAFDYETNMLKPDGPQAAIRCCSICWEGKETISFPWTGLALKREMSRLLRSKSTEKIASNLKFEERWTRKEFGHGVRNWKWDTMLAAHWLDNRRGITSIKFQSFVLLGEQDYDSHLKSKLFSKGGNEQNRVRDIPIRELLLYCGMDSLLEYKVAKIQMNFWKRRVK